MSVTMTTPVTDGKMLINALYHSAVNAGLAMGYSKISKMVIGGPPPKPDFTPRDVGMIFADIALTMSTKDLLVRQGIIPADIITK